MAIRAALGASRSRLIGELLSESVGLAILGGLLGVALAAWGTRLLLTIGPAALPRVAEVRMDGVVLAFSLGVTLLAGVLLGVAPAVQFGKPGSLEALRGARVVGSRASSRLRRILVVAQVAFAMVLCLTAGWMARSFQKVRAIDPGLTANHLLLLRLSLPGPAYSEPSRVVAFLERLFLETERLPGVSGVTAANVVPLSAMNVRSDFTIVGRPPVSPTDIPGAQMRWVMPSYFRTMGIPVLEGREFTWADSARSRPVVVVDQALARHFFPEGNALGAHLRLRNPTGSESTGAEVVGIAGNVKHFGLEEETLPTLYAPIPQIGSANDFSALRNSMFLAVRADREPLALTDAVRRQVRALDPNAPASGARTIEQMLAIAVASRRFSMRLLVTFALVTVALAAMGLYAVMAYTVEQTRREIGIRLALGAQPTSILKRMAGEGACLAAIGIAIGLVLALSASRLVAGMLFQVSTTEPKTLITAVLFLAATLVVASYVPARRAARTDPNIALRFE